MVMVFAYEHAPGQYNTRVASGVGTSQRGEAMTLLLCVHQLVLETGVFWVVSVSESGIGAMCTYQEGRHGGDGIHHKYAHTSGPSA